jgi:ankyrin repeat protein
MECLDTLDTLGFNPIHQAVTGLSGCDPEQALRMHPELTNAADTSGETPLHWAFRRTDATGVSLLLRHGAEPDARDHANQTPLFLLGSGADSVPCMQLLIDSRADVNALADRPPHEISVLTTATLRKNAKAVCLLLASEANPNPPGYPPVVSAAQNGVFCAVRALVDAGAEIDACDDEGYSAVMMAVLANSAECVEFLISRGACLNFVALDGESVLDLAACCAGVVVMRLLAAAGVRGLPMTESDVAGYRTKFERMRDCDFVGEREPAEEEQAAFDALLASASSKRRREGGHCHWHGDCQPQEQEMLAGEPGRVLIPGMWPNGD